MVAVAGFAGAEVGAGFAVGPFEVEAVAAVDGVVHVYVNGQMLVHAAGFEGNAVGLAIGLAGVQPGKGFGFGGCAAFAQQKGLSRIQMNYQNGLHPAFGGVGIAGAPAVDFSAGKAVGIGFVVVRAHVFEEELGLFGGFKGYGIKIGPREFPFAAAAQSEQNPKPSPFLHEVATKWRHVCSFRHDSRHRLWQQTGRNHRFGLV